MFSITPNTGTFSFSNIITAFVASSSDTAFGVVTITAPAIGASCAMLIEASLVPGGRSTTR